MQTVKSLSVSLVSRNHFLSLCAFVFVAGQQKQPPTQTLSLRRLVSIVIKGFVTHCCYLPGTT